VLVFRVLSCPSVDSPRNHIPKQTCSLEVAAKRLGWGKNAAYAAVRSGQFPVPVLRSGPKGRIIRVPIKALDDLLGPLPNATDAA
jgi:hypothetical protein